VAYPKYGRGESRWWRDDVVGVIIKESKRDSVRRERGVCMASSDVAIVD
jgi:hypothetical protein